MNVNKEKLKAAKRIANILRRSASYRTYPISDSESKDNVKMQDYSRRDGFNSGLSLALSILIMEIKLDD